MLTFSTNVSQRFLRKYLPKVMLTQITTSVDKHKFDNMDAYLRTMGIQQNTLQVLKCALRYLDIKQAKGVYRVDVSSVLKLGNYTLKQLVDLIDYGNTEVKGTQVYVNAEKYVKKNKAHIVYDYYNER